MLLVGSNLLLQIKDVQILLRCKPSTYSANTTTSSLSAQYASNKQKHGFNSSLAPIIFLLINVPINQSFASVCTTPITTVPHVSTTQTHKNTRPSRVH